MSDEKIPRPVAHGKMRPNKGTPPGIEMDGHGHVIPLAERTKEDRDAARAAGEKDGSIKNPEHEAENPAPMPRELQGKGGRGKDHDPEGQQGGRH